MWKTLDHDAKVWKSVTDWEWAGNVGLALLYADLDWTPDGRVVSEFLNNMAAVEGSQHFVTIVQNISLMLDVNNYNKEFYKFADEGFIQWDKGHLGEALYAEYIGQAAWDNFCTNFRRASEVVRPSIL
jgi:hypothetical protein